jgi:CheY-like chemotaxis protein
MLGDNIPQLWHDYCIKYIRFSFFRFNAFTLCFSVLAKTRYTGIGLKIDIKNMTVLVVDDVPLTCKLVRKLMKTLGFGETFHFANNGQQALSILTEEKIDLVLMDYNMPEMNGVEALSRIRENRKLRDIPVIMITAQALSDYVAEVGESDIDAYILKPINVKVLEEKVIAVIDKANNPPPMVYHLKKARQYEDEGDLLKAVEEARLAMEADPSVTRPIRELGYYYLKMGQYKVAEKWLLKAAKLNPLDVFSCHHLGELYMKKNNFNKAEYYFDNAMKISPRHLSRCINFGKTLIRMKRFEKAMRVFERAFNLPDSTSELREEIADFCLNRGAHEYAIKLLEESLKDEPQRSDLLQKMALAMEKLGDISQAIPFLARASNLDRDNDDIKIKLATYYLAIKKPLMAEQPLKTILKSNPGHQGARDLLRQCL